MRVDTAVAAESAFRTESCCACAQIVRDTVQELWYSVAITSVLLDDVGLTGWS